MWELHAEKSKGLCASTSWFPATFNVNSEDYMQQNHDHAAIGNHQKVTLDLNFGKLHLGKGKLNLSFVS